MKNNMGCEITGRCAGCEKVRMLTGGGNWSFPACYHPPYKGKWCAEIKDCPKEAAQAGKGGQDG